MHASQQTRTSKPPFHQPSQPALVEECFEHDICIRFNGKERTDIEEYNISEGWVKVSSPTTKDLFGRPLLIKLKVEVEAFYK
ncbi:MAG: hypothetical protein ACJA2K_000517 [Thalassolituus sp.]|jgi:hypothetical protein